MTGIPNCIFQIDHGVTGAGARRSGDLTLLRNLPAVMNDWRVYIGPLPDKLDPAGEQLRWSDPFCALTVTLIEQSDGITYRLRIGHELIVDARPDSIVIARLADGYSRITLEHILVDVVLPRLLAHAGTLVIHAGAVQICDRALMIVGPSGRGKSTLAASFNQAGFAMLGDDAMIISGLPATPAVRSVYPSLRLLPDSFAAVLPAEIGAVPVAHYSDKQRIEAAVTPASWRTLPIAAIVALAPAGADSEAWCGPMTPAETCMSLVESSFALDPSDVHQAQRRLADASALARAVPAFEIAYPRDYARLAEVRQAILDHLGELEPA